jgi:hypothetical protein
MLIYFFECRPFSVCPPRDHDKAPGHPSLRVSHFLAGKRFSAMDHPLYSPDLAPADFCLFPELKNVLEGKRFSVIENTKSSVKRSLTDIPVQV